MTVKLGDRVQDIVTGYKGIAVCHMQWLHGCLRIGVQSEAVDKDGKPVDPIYFDEPQLVVLSPQVVAVGERETGGPHGYEPTGRR